MLRFIDLTEVCKREMMDINSPELLTVIDLKEAGMEVKVKSF